MSCKIIDGVSEEEPVDVDSDTIVINTKASAEDFSGIVENSQQNKSTDGRTQSNYRNKYRSMYMASNKSQTEAFEEDATAAMGNFVDYLNSITAMQKKRSPYSMLMPKQVPDTEWSLNWPPYLLMARLAVVLFSLSLRFLFMLSEWSTPPIKYCATYFFENLEKTFQNGVDVAGWPAIIMKSFVMVILCGLFTFLTVLKYSFKFLLTPIKQRDR